MSNSESGIDLLTPGCLGTCWYGNYHYLEPWVGCEHDCDYCYARFRSNVAAAVAERKTTFERPALQMPLDEMCRRLSEDLARLQVKILKISRFTDFFSASTVERGWSKAVLETLTASSVPRVIITTKGVPDEACLSIMAAHPERFSFNVVAKPISNLGFESLVPPLEARLQAARRMQEAGVLTTIHLDPLVPGFEDQSPALEQFADLLVAHGLKRAMFSLLLLNDAMIDMIRRRRGSETADRLIALYEDPSERPYLPGQDETVYRQPKAEVRSACVSRVSSVLTERDFAFVLCSLKSGRGSDGANDGCPRCDGKFYA